MFLKSWLVTHHEWSPASVESLAKIQVASTQLANKNKFS